MVYLFSQAVAETYSQIEKTGIGGAGIMKKLKSYKAFSYWYFNIFMLK